MKITCLCSLAADMCWSSKLCFFLCSSANSSLCRHEVTQHTLITLRGYTGPCMYYHIVLIFRESKFSQIAVLQEFVEKISQMCVAHACDSRVAQILAE